MALSLRLKILKTTLHAKHFRSEAGGFYVVWEAIERILRHLGSHRTDPTPSKTYSFLHERKIFVSCEETINAQKISKSLSPMRMPPTCGQTLRNIDDTSCFDVYSRTQNQSDDISRQDAKSNEIYRCVRRERRKFSKSRKPKKARKSWKEGSKSWQLFREPPQKKCLQKNEVDLSTRN